VTAARDRWVARGISTPSLVVDRADGARVWDVDGREYVDFAGGLGCQNTGHGLPAAVAAIHEQVDRYLHQCFMVGMYEPYVEVCRRLGELSPCAGDEQRSLLVNSGAEAVENAVKVARAATGRQGVVVFDHAFHGRTLLTMTMTSKVAYKRGFGPFAPEVYRAPSPYPYRGVGTDEAIAGLELLFSREVDPESIACVVLEPVQGEGGFIVMPPDFPVALKSICERHGILYVDDEVQSGVGRTGPVWAIDHYGVAPDLLVSGKSLGGGLPLAGLTGNADVMDAPSPGGLGGTFGGNPVACAAACAVLDEVASDEFRARADELGTMLRDGLAAIAERVPAVGEARGLGPMCALELVRDRKTKEPAPELANATVARALDRGLILLTCGLHGNVVRVLVPLVISDEDLARGLEMLEDSLVT
jgi:4-aminobutyrate aminotransferase